MTTEIKDTNRGTWTSASNAQADSLCAGRHLAQRDIPEIKNEDADYGNAVHAALAKQDSTGLSLEQTEIYDACNEIDGRVLVKYFGAEVAEKQPNPVREKRFWVQWPDGLRHSGQVDSAHRKGVKALIVDYKTLPGQQPESPANMQLRDLVCLLDANSPLLQEVAVAVVQPLVTYDPEITVYQRADIMRAREEMSKRVNASNKSGQPRTPGELQCKYCRAKSICKEYQSFASQLVVYDDKLVADMQGKVMAEWTPDMWSLALTLEPTARKWLDEMKDTAKARLQADPQSIPGFELTPGKRRETITNPQAVFDSFSQKGGTLEQFMACIKVGKTALKEQVAAITKTKGKALDAEVKAVIGQNSELSQDEPSIKNKKE